MAKGLTKTVTIKNFATTTSATVSCIPGFIESTISVKERVAEWYIKPLKRMHGSEGFIVLLVLFPLYEKHLRTKYQFADHFTLGHRVFKIVGKHLGLNQSEAFYFWSTFRNGLLHHGVPKTSQDFVFAMLETGPAIEKKDSIYWINPFELRNRLLQEIEPDINAWKTDLIKIARVHKSL